MSQFLVILLVGLAIGPATTHRDGILIMGAVLALTSSMSSDPEMRHGHLNPEGGPEM